MMADLLLLHECRYIKKRDDRPFSSLDAGRKYSVFVHENIALSRRVNRNKRGSPYPMIVEPDRLTESANCIEFQWNE